MYRSFMKIRNALLLVIFSVAAAHADDRGRVRLDLPQDFESTARVFSVKRRALRLAKDQMTIGPYRVIDYHQGWTRSSSDSSGVIPPYLHDPLHVTAEERKSLTRFQFALADADGTRWSARCEQGSTGSSTSVRGVPITASSRDAVVCALDNAATSEQWKLTFDQSGSFERAQVKTTGGGELTDGKTTYDVVGVSQLKNGHHVPLPMAFLFIDGERTLGALELTDKHSLLLPAAGDPKRDSLIASAAAAMVVTTDSH